MSTQQTVHEIYIHFKKDISKAITSNAILKFLKIAQHILCVVLVFCWDFEPFNMVTELTATNDAHSSVLPVLFCIFQEFVNAYSCQFVVFSCGGLW